MKEKKHHAISSNGLKLVMFPGTDNMVPGAAKTVEGTHRVAVFSLDPALVRGM